jgi:hypothetical protein
MKRSFFSVLIVWTSFVVVYGQDYLRIWDPNRTWQYINGGITEAEYILRPGKNYVTCDLYLTYACKSPNYIADFQYELAHNFSLPSNVLVSDSWLWVDTLIMKADILERNEAINIYEGIVNRRRDPSLLLKNSSTSYHYKIYPIFNNATRKVKLRFEIPIEIQKHERTFSIPLGLVLVAAPKPNVTIKIVDEENYDLIPEGGTPLELVNDPKLGMIYQKVMTPETDALTFKIKDEESKPKFTFAVESETGTPSGFYQLSMHPSKVFEYSTHEEKNVIILIEHDSVYSHLNKNSVLVAVEEFVRQYLQEGDSLQILYNGAGVKKHYPDFIPYSAMAAYPSITGIKPASFSSVPGSIFQAYYDLKNRSNPILVIFSSAGNVVSTAIAQSVKDELVNTHGKLLKTFVLSYVNERAPAVTYSSVSYRGNNLLYTILTSNSGGHLQTTPTSVRTMAAWKPFRISFGNQFDLLTQKPFEIQFNFKPHNGLTYDNIVLKNDANGWMQIGRFAGSPPFQLDAVLWIDDQLSQRSIVVDDEEQRHLLATMTQVHHGNKILQMENGNLNGNRIKIINTSIGNRVLSRFTAFLALEPGLQEPCTDCVDESTTSTNDLAESVSWKVYPNPFSDKVMIELSGLLADEKPEEVSLYNVSGAIQNVLVHVVQDKDNWLIEIEGSHLPAGVYILKVRVGKRILTCKVVKV